MCVCIHAEGQTKVDSRRCCTAAVLEIRLERRNMMRTGGESGCEWKRKKKEFGAPLVLVDLAADSCRLLSAKDAIPLSAYG